MWYCKTVSKILQKLQIIEMGLKFMMSDLSPFLNAEQTFDCLHIEAIVHHLMPILNKNIKERAIALAQYFKLNAGILSEPVVFLGFTFLRAHSTLFLLN